MRKTLRPRDLRPIEKAVRRAHRVLARAYPGESQGRQPVHTVYGGAPLFKPDTPAKLGALARAALDEYAPDARTLHRALGLESEALAASVRRRVVEQLTREPVEDYRIDFEDGYGYRPDGEEDGHAVSAAEAVAHGLIAKTLPPCIGVRIKALTGESSRRSLRTLDLFVTTLATHTKGTLPPQFRVTIPKVMAPDHVEAAARACAALERRLRLPKHTLALEIMVETPQALFASDGTPALPALVAAGRGRVVAAHFGAYDYTALCGITAAWQHMRHPACDFARHVMQVSLAQSGVQISDGGTTAMPVAPHRSTDRALTAGERRANRETVHRAWKVHFDDVQHSLRLGFYQGWDLHPAQLPTRFAAIHAFFLTARPAATARLRAFVDKAAQASRVGDVFDDAATGQGLLNFFARGLNCGALTADEVAETGLTAAEIAGRSFAAIMSNRRGDR